MANAAVLKTAALKGAYRFESCALRRITPHARPAHMPSGVRDAERGSTHVRRESVTARRSPHPPGGSTSFHA